MSQQSTIKRYHLIINKLRKAPASFIEISAYLEDMSITDDQDYSISVRTFKRYINDISSIYDIEIEYDFSSKAYRILYDTKDEAKSRLIEAFDLIDSFRTNEEIASQVLFEKRRPIGTEHLYGILHAIKNRVQIEYTYQKYWGDSISERIVAPHALKEFNHRWYLIAYDISDKTKKLKTYALDRISELSISATKYQAVSDFDGQEHFKHCFGIVGRDDEKVEEVILSFTAHQGKYIKSLPIHPSQKVLIDDDNEFRISLHLYVTHDLVMELLSYAANMKVIQPVSLANEMKRMFLAAAEKYN